MAVIFISHASVDAEITEKIKAWLAEQNFQNVFLDFDAADGINPGESWERRLYDEIARSQAVILVHTENWLDSKWCFVEFAQARALGKPIFPVILSPLVRPLVTPELQAVDLLDWSEANRARLERSIRRVTSEVARGFRWEGSRSPYPGINAFERSDAAIFFGRDEETREIVAMLDSRRVQGGDRVILVQGPSGGGKSSVVQAGVLPQLERETGSWIVVGPMRPQSAPLTRLAKALAEAAATPDAWQSWLDGLHEDPRHSLMRFAAEMRTGARAGSTILLAFDQLEELEACRQVERNSILRVLWEALNTASELPFMMIGTIRTDASDRLTMDPTFATLRLSTFLLRALPMRSVRRLIEGPALVASIALETGLSDRIVTDIETVDALPLLAFTLRELYERFGRARSAITIADYEGLGDPASGLSPIEVALRRKAEDTLRAHGIDEAGLAALRRAFIPNLIRLDDQGRPLRRMARFAAMPEGAVTLLHALVDARLLRAGGGTNDLQIEVAHEALFRVWPQLADWIAEELDFLRLLYQVEQQERLWRDASEAERRDALLGGLLLARTRTTYGREPDRFGALDRFVQASLAEDDARRAEERRQRDAILFAQSRMLTRLARDCLASGNSTTAIQLALSALPAPDMPRPFLPEARAVLQSAVRDHREIGRAQLGGPVDKCMFVDSGARILAFCGQQGKTQVFDLSGRELARAEMHAKIAPWRMEQAGDLFIMVEERSDVSQVGIWTTEGRKLGLFEMPRTARAHIEPGGRFIIVNDRTKISLLSRFGLITAEIDIHQLELPMEAELWSADAHRDARLVAISIFAERRAVAWYPDTGFHRDLALEGECRALAVCGDESVVVVCSEDSVLVFGPEGDVRLKYKIPLGASHCRLTVSRDDRFATLSMDEHSSCLLGLREHSIAMFQGPKLEFGPADLLFHHSSDTLFLESRSGERVATFPGAHVADCGVDRFVLDRGAHFEVRGIEGQLIYPVAHDALVYRAALNPDEKLVVTGCLDGEVRIWSVDAVAHPRKEVAEKLVGLDFVEDTDGLLLVEHGEKKLSLYSTSLDPMASSSRRKKWDLVGAGGVIVLPHPQGLRVQDARRCINLVVPCGSEAEHVRISAASDRILIWTRAGKVEVWNLADNCCEFSYVSEELHFVDFLSGDALQIFDAGSLSVCDIGGGVRASTNSHEFAPQEPFFSASGEIIVSMGARGGWQTLDQFCNPVAAFQKPIYRDRPHTNFVEVRETDGIAVYRFDGLRLLETSARAELSSSPDGSRLAVAPPQEANVMLYDIGGDLVAELTQPDLVMRIAFSPNSEHLLTLCLDGSARIWDRDGRLCGSVTLPRSRIVALSDGATRIAVVPTEQPTTIEMLPGLLPEDELYRLARRLAPATLTERQRLRYEL